MAKRDPILTFNMDESISEYPKPAMINVTSDVDGTLWYGDSSTEALDNDLELTANVEKGFGYGGSSLGLPETKTVYISFIPKYTSSYNSLGSKRAGDYYTSKQVTIQKGTPVFEFNGNLSVEYPNTARLRVSIVPGVEWAGYFDRGGTIYYSTSQNMSNSLTASVTSISFTKQYDLALTKTNIGSDTYYFSFVPDSTSSKFYNALGSASQYYTTATLTVTKPQQDAPTVTSSSKSYGNTVIGSASGGGGYGTLYYKQDTNGGTNYGTLQSTAPSRSSVGTTTYIAYWSGDSTYDQSPNSAQGSLTITKASQPMSISPTSRTIYNRSGYNTFTITPSNAQGSVSYSSSNTSVATVNSSGVVTYAGAGSCTITVTAAGNGNYESGSKTCSVTCVVDSVKSLSTSTSTTTISYNGTATITVTASYESGFSTDVTTSTSYTTNPTGIITIS